MNWWNDFADRIEADAPLGRLTWYRLGGHARWLFRPRDETDLAALWRRARQEAVPLKVLGRGANILVRDDGFDGVVIRLDDGPFLRVERQCAELEAGAGVDLMRLTKACSRRGLSGLEGLAGIPGTVGGAVRMNAGGRYGEMRDVVSRLRILNENGAIDMLNHDEVGFGYRHSDLDGRIVLSARLRLKHDDPKETFARYREFFAIKQRTQPLVEPSAGCIFKNPNGKSAGALIDQAGMKGVSSGQARVSERHANFIVAGRGATSSDVLRLIDLIRERILSLFGIQLETEIDIW